MCKICKKCKQTKSLSEFQYINTIKKYRDVCKDCLNKKRRDDRTSKRIEKEKNKPIEVFKEYRVCISCSEEKHFTLFRKNKVYKDGISNLCCSCSNKREREKSSTKTVIHKTCPKCKTLKSSEDFNKNKKAHDGLNSYCKSCRSLERRKDKKRLNVRPKKELEYKMCAKCKETKEVSQFYKNVNRVDGLTCYCKACTSKKTEREYTEEELEDKYCPRCDRVLKKHNFTPSKAKIYKDGRNKYCRECAGDRNKGYKVCECCNKKLLVSTHFDGPNTKTCSVCCVQIKKINGKIYRQKNKHIIASKRNKYVTPLTKVAAAIRGRLKNNLESCNFRKTKTTKQYGIDCKEIYEYVGPCPGKGFHLDHIIPLRAFDYNNPEHIKMSFSKYNMRWIEGAKNISKNDKICWSLISSIPEVLEIATKIGLNETHDEMRARHIMEKTTNARL